MNSFQSKVEKLTSILNKKKKALWQATGVGELTVTPLRKPQLYHASAQAEIEDPSCQELKA